MCPLENMEQFVIVMTHPFKIVCRKETTADRSEDTVTLNVRFDEAQHESDLAAAETAERVRLRKAAETAGYEEGFRRGRAEAVKEVRSSLADALTSLQAVERHMEQEMSTGREAMARSAIEIGAGVAEALLGSPAAFDRVALLAGILAETKIEIEPGAGLTVICRACPDTLSELDAALPATVARTADSSMRPGGFVLEARRGTDGSVLDRWDASIERASRIIRNFQFNV